MNGVLVLDKPNGITSHDAVLEARRALAMDRIGHTGTLDPLATGVLPLLLGEATKLSPYLTAGEKEYTGTLCLGVETDTLDSTGAVLRRSPVAGLDEEDVARAFSLFQGVIRQSPPAYSAVKVQGRPLYAYARKGVPVSGPDREVEVLSLTISRISLPLVDFSVRCTKGTFVRRLASDIGKELGCGAHLTALRRTRSGPFTLERALTIEDMASRAREGTIRQAVIPMDRALVGVKAISVTHDEAEDLRHGRPLGGGHHPLEPGALGKVTVKKDVEEGEELVAVVEGCGTDVPMKILRVFNPGV